MDNDERIRKHRTYLTLEEVGEKLGISATAARVLILYDNAIPHLEVGERGIRVRESDLDTYIAKLKELNG